MQYFPSVDLLTKALKISVNDFNSKKKALVGISFLRQLIEAALESVEFDEKWYLAQYEDVREAHRTGAIKDPREHFITTGYFEGRRPSANSFDGIWYVNENKDVAEALRMGRLDSPFTHYQRVGEGEGRAPSEGTANQVAKWMVSLFGKR